MAGRFASPLVMPRAFSQVEDLFDGTRAIAASRTGHRDRAGPGECARLCGQQEAGDFPGQPDEGQPHHAAEHHDPRPVSDPNQHGRSRRKTRHHGAGTRPQPSPGQAARQPVARLLRGAGDE